MRIKILGWGEVGKAIGELFSSVDFEIFIQDPAIGFRIDSHEKGFDFLFVCIPYSDSFISEVKKAMGSDIKKVVIFSTVPIYTTEKIPDAIHVPIEGKHPDLVKYLNGWDITVGMRPDNKYEHYYKELLYRVFNVNQFVIPEISEACKLLSTLYYGVQIEFQRYVFKLLGNNYVYFNEYNKAYNMLYKEACEQVSRSILYPPEGKIGGHCVVNNAKFLNSIWSDIVINGKGDKERS